MSSVQGDAAFVLFGISLFIAIIGYFHYPESDTKFKSCCYWIAGFFILPVVVKMLLILF